MREAGLEFPQRPTTKEEEGLRTSPDFQSWHLHFDSPVTHLCSHHAWPPSSHSSTPKGLQAQYQLSPPLYCSGHLWVQGLESNPN